MASFNQASLIGFVGEDPITIATATGKKVTKFTVATTEKGYTSQTTGISYPDRTEWHNIVLWGRLAEVAEKFLRKGSSVFVQGKLHTRSYEDKNGIRRYITEIEADTMQMLDRRAENSQQPQQPASPVNYETPNSPSLNKKDDDLPF